MFNFLHKVLNSTPEDKWTEVLVDLSTSGVSTSDETRIAQGKAVKSDVQVAGQTTKHPLSKQEDTPIRLSRKPAMKTVTKALTKNTPKVVRKESNHRISKEPRSQSYTGFRNGSSHATRTSATNPNVAKHTPAPAYRQQANQPINDRRAKTNAEHTSSNQVQQQARVTLNQATPVRLTMDQPKVPAAKTETQKIHLSPMVMQSIAAATMKTLPIRRAHSTCGKAEAKKMPAPSKTTARAYPNIAQTTNSAVVEVDSIANRRANVNGDVVKERSIVDKSCREKKLLCGVSNKQENSARFLYCYT